jgi:hypothetical protein
MKLLLWLGAAAIGVLLIAYAFVRSRGGPVTTAANVPRAVSSPYAIPSLPPARASTGAPRPSGNPVGTAAANAGTRFGTALGGPVGGYAAGQVAGNVSNSLTAISQGRGSTQDVINVGFPLGAVDLPFVGSTNSLIAGGVNAVGDLFDSIF